MDWTIGPLDLRLLDYFSTISWTKFWTIFKGWVGTFVGGG